MYSGPSYQSAPNRRALYTNVKALKLPTCDECFANQHETRGASGHRLEARTRRVLPGGTALNLCRIHEELWRRKDAEDAPKR
jgi:hypothetical protein